jgi:TonB family protein
MRTEAMLAVMLAAGLVSSGVVEAKDRPVLSPTSKWQMDYAPSECRLLRSFGEGKDRITLQFSRLGVDDVLGMTLAGQELPKTEKYVLAKVSTSTMSEVPDTYARGYAASRDTPAIVEFSNSAGIPRALRSDASADQMTRLGVRIGPFYSVQFDLGSMKGPLAAIDKCMDYIVTSWGLDPTEQRNRASAPQPISDPRSWFRSSDYPVGQNENALGGYIAMRLLVTAEGSVKSCSIAKSGGDKAFEDLTCKLARARARFLPAVGQGGQSMESVWISTILWQPSTPLMSQPD